MMMMMMINVTVTAASYTLYYGCVSHSIK